MSEYAVSCMTPMILMIINRMMLTNCAYCRLVIPNALGIYPCCIRLVKKVIDVLFVLLSYRSNTFCHERIARPLSQSLFFDKTVSLVVRYFWRIAMRQLVNHNCVTIIAL